jgi:hypothetical protein
MRLAAGPSLPPWSIFGAGSSGAAPIAMLTDLSVDMYRQSGVSALLTSELKRVMTQKANAAFLAQPAPTAPAITPPAGILNQPHSTGGTFEDNLDAVSDAIAQIEAEGGTADLIVASPQSWSAVSKLKTSEDMPATSIIGCCARTAGATHDQRRRAGPTRRRRAHRRMDGSPGTSDE